MLPSSLKPEQFAAYPPEARKLVLAHLDALRQVPLSFLPSLLREVIDYDSKFPAERAAIERELANLSSLSPAQMQDWFHGFSQCSLSPQLEQSGWVDQPAQFVERLSAYLWTTHQLDAFREAATVYGNRLRLAAPPAPLPVPRLGIAIVGQGVAAYDGPLFRKLRAHGTYFAKVKPERGLEQALTCAATRAKTAPQPYGHWYVDGGRPAECSALLTAVSYDGLAPVRAALLKNVTAEIARPGMGPEELRSHLARLSPADLGADANAKPGTSSGTNLDTGSDAVLARFQLKLLTEGSGTQIFSTAFAQWTAREVLRRAQALTLVVRFAPRQRQRPMNELLAGSGTSAELDAAGSLVDADMAAYYHWLNQQRLPGAERSSFVAWFEGHTQAVAIGPSLPRNTESSSAIDMAELLALASG